MNTLKKSTDPSLYLAKCLALFLADVEGQGVEEPEKRMRSQHERRMRRNEEQKKEKLRNVEIESGLNVE